MLFDTIDSHRLKGSVTDMERDLGDLHAGRDAAQSVPA